MSQHTSSRNTRENISYFSRNLERHLHLQVKSEGEFVPTITGLRFAKILDNLFFDRKYKDNKRVLDLGCGAGLLSLVSLAHGATVTAVDIAQSNVEATLRNARLNGFSIEALRSDAFSSLDGRFFDMIVCNPPLLGAPGDAFTQQLLAQLRDNMSKDGRMASEAVVYMTSNAVQEIQKEILLWNSKTAVILSEVFVCLSRKSFADTYGRFALDEWVVAGGAFERSGRYFLKGTFCNFQYN